MPEPRAMRATSAATPPKPTSPSVLPVSWTPSIPSHGRDRRLQEPDCGGMLFICEVKVYRPDIGLPRFRGQASSRANVAAPSDPRAERARRAHVVTREMCYR